MSNFRIIAIPRRDPDLDRVVAVLVALAIAEREKERTRKASEAKEARG